MGRHVPARGPIQDFQAWTDRNYLVHLPTIGTLYTWSNRRSGHYLTKRRLDQVVCNQAWFDCWISSLCCTLTRRASDHFPILFEFHNYNTNFRSQFKFLKLWTSNPDCCKINMVRGPILVLTNKLKHLKEQLKIWNANCFGNINEKSQTSQIQPWLHSIPYWPDWQHKFS